MGNTPPRTVFPAWFGVSRGHRRLCSRPGRQCHTSSRFLFLPQSVKALSPQHSAAHRAGTGGSWVLPQLRCPLGLGCISVLQRLAEATPAVRGPAVRVLVCPCLSRVTSRLPALQASEAGPDTAMTASPRQFYQLHCGVRFSHQNKFLIRLPVAASLIALDSASVTHAFTCICSFLSSALLLQRNCPESPQPGAFPVCQRPQELIRYPSSPLYVQPLYWVLREALK